MLRHIFTNGFRNLGREIDRFPVQVDRDTFHVPLGGQLILALSV
jgi:hypothetical protein